MGCGGVRPCVYQQTSKRTASPWLAGCISNHKSGHDPDFLVWRTSLRQDNTSVSRAVAWVQSDAYSQGPKLVLTHAQDDKTCRGVPPWAPLFRGGSAPRLRRGAPTEGRPTGVRLLLADTTV